MKSLYKVDVVEHEIETSHILSINGPRHESSVSDFILIMKISPVLAL
jgi:hypothetical protein